MIAALAFIPKDKLIDAFMELSEYLPEDTRPIQDYFEDHYIGRPQRRGRRQPIFPMDIWNMFDRAAEELPKTNNFVEGWHRSFQSNVGSSHPNIWKFIGYIQREQALQQVQIIFSSPICMSASDVCHVYLCSKSFILILLRI